MLIRYGYDMTVACEQDTAMVSLLDVHAERRADIVWERPLRAEPATPISSYVDMFGNICRRFVAPKGELRLQADGVIADSGDPEPVTPGAAQAPIPHLPDACLTYVVGSRYCETDKLGAFAWKAFGKTPAGWARVQAICDFVHGHVRFGYEHARATRTAVETYEEKVGVCRDFAHLALTLCRCMNIPARYVNGYLGDIGVPIEPTPMDFSAWFEVFLDGRWHTFDARHNTPRIGRIVLARGRDATDIPLLNSFGPHVLKNFRVWTYEEREPGWPPSAIDDPNAPGPPQPSV